MPCLQLCIVQQEVIFKGTHFGIEFEDEWASSWDVVCDDLILSHVGQVFDDGAEGVAVSAYHNPLALQDLGTDRVVPVGQDAIDGDLERLGPRENIRGQQAVASIESWVSFVIHLELGRWDVIAASPLENLLLAVLLSCLRLVETLEGAIVSLVKSPRLVVRDPEMAHLFSHGVVGLNGAGQVRCVSQVEFISLLQEKFASVFSLLLSKLCEVDVMPACESVSKVPG